MKIHSWGKLTNLDYELKIFQPEFLIRGFGEKSILPLGANRSYGDVALNETGQMWSTDSLKNFLELDTENLTVRVESGINFRELERVLNLNGLTLLVRPGTSYLTVGGAIANDIHGKSHEQTGSFGCQLISMRLWRSDSGEIEVSPTQSPELFYSTIGGIGLTGLILDATFKVGKLKGNLIKAENIAFRNLEEFKKINESSSDYDSNVSWVAISGKMTGKGIYTRGISTNEFKEAKASTLTFPKWNGPSLVNKSTVKAFNQLYFKKGKLFKSSSLVPADKYYFPLDGLNQWNNIYGKRGFYQYQSVVPPKDAIAVTNEMLQIIKKSGQSSFLTVLKTFGAKQSGGLLSFPMPGLTLAVDLPNRGEETLSLMKRLDEIVATAGGRLYLAKDARVSKEFFQSSYPEYEKFEKLRDPKFSSNMSRRLMGW